MVYVWGSLELCEHIKHGLCIGERLELCEYVNHGLQDCSVWRKSPEKC
jgi:hypothetical protein